MTTRSDDQSEKRRWLRIADLHIKQQASHESSRLRFSDEHLTRQFDDFHVKLNHERAAFETDLVDSVYSIKRTVSNARDVVNKSVSCAVNKEALKTVLSKAERDLSSLQQREVENRQRLNKDEALLTRDLELMLERVSAPQWNNSESRQVVYNRAPLNATDRESGLLPEVLEYDAYLESHGLTDGWQPDDHREYVRLLEICKGDYSLTTQLCCDELIGISREAIINHSRWHSVFCDLAEKKRIAIARWRSEKNEGELNKHTNSHALLKRNESSREKRRKKEEERIKREVQHEMLSVWRREKEEKARLQAREEQKRTEEEIKKRRCQRKARNQRKALINAYRLRKQDAERGELEKRRCSRLAEQAETSVRKEESRRRIAQRNDEMIRSRKTKIEEKRQRRLQGTEVIRKQRFTKAERDFNRLMQRTAASRNRDKALSESMGGSGDARGMYIRNVPHKAVPFWIQTSRSISAL